MSQIDHERQRLQNKRPGWTYGSTVPCKCKPRVKTIKRVSTLGDGHIALKMCVECNSQWVHHSEG